METKFHRFQTVALVEVSGHFHPLVALLSGERTPLHRRSAQTHAYFSLDAMRKIKIDALSVIKLWSFSPEPAALVIQPGTSRSTD
jgi:hypothetical protein